jgi:hypothetical protein
MQMDFFKTIIDAGGVAAVAAIFLWYLDRQDKRVNTLMGNHLSHSTDAMEKMSNALTRLSVVIEQFIKRSKEKEKKNAS